MDSSLARRIAVSEDICSAFGCDVTHYKEYATIAYSDCIYGWNINQVRLINCQKDVNGLVSRIEESMDWPSRQYSIYTDFRTNPQNVAACLRESGYRPIPLLTQVFKGERIEPQEIWPIESVNQGNMSAWEELVFSIYMDAESGVDFANDMVLFGKKKMKTEVGNGDFAMLVCMDGDIAIGQAEVFTKDGVSSIGNIYVRGKYRNHGVATNLVYAGLEHAKKMGSEDFYLVTYSFDTPRYAYNKMGFHDLFEGILWAKLDDDQFDMVF